MPGNTFGNIFKVTTFGESHGEAMGAVIDGCPAGLEISICDIEKELARRRPGKEYGSRDEQDTPEFLSGVFEGKTLGSPIAVVVRNENQNSKDYDELKDIYRPGHADFTWDAKYGFRDHRGGGRSSGRETLCRVAAGAIAKKFLAVYGIEINAKAITDANIEELKKEGISFYSGRHYWKTLMNANRLGDAEEFFMGHKVSSNMAELYNHRNKQGQKMILKKACKVLSILDKTIFKQ